MFISYVDLIVIVRVRATAKVTMVGQSCPTQGPSGLFRLRAIPLKEANKLVLQRPKGL